MIENKVYRESSNNKEIINNSIEETSNDLFDTQTQSNKFIINN